MKVKILGCGTSTGVPLPGCTCNVCTSGDIKNYRDRTSAYIELDNQNSILIDATTDLRQQSLKWNIKQVGAVLYTHGHADHILGTDDLRVFNFRTKAPIPCYGTRETLQTIEKTFPYIFSRKNGYEGGMLAQLELIEISPLKPFHVHGTEVLPFELFHGKMPVTGFRIGNFVYATDCNSIPEASKSVMKGARYLILDGLRYEPHKTHFTIPESIEAALELGAEQTYLIHMTHSLDYSATNAELPETIELAYDGLELSL